MLNSIFAKTVYEKRWVLLGWTIGMLALAVLTMSFYPSFNKQGIDEIIGSVPESMRALIGSVESFKTIPGYIAQQVYGPQIPIFTVILAIILFIGVGVGEEDRGNLDTLLATPVSRRQIFWQKFLAVGAVLAVICLSIGAGVLVGTAMIHESISLLRVAEATFACWLMTMAYGTVAYAVGMATGRKGLAIAVGSAYAFISFFLSSLAPAVKVLQPFEKLSIFYYYNSPQPMVDGLDPSHTLVIIAVILVLTFGSLARFNQRDIGV